METLTEKAVQSDAAEFPAALPVQTKKKRNGVQKSEDRQLLLLCLPALIKVFLFSYLPLIGLVMAFQFYIPRRGLFGSTWMGFANFDYLLKSSIASRLITNAIAINLLGIVFGTVCAL